MNKLLLCILLSGSIAGSSFAQGKLPLFDKASVTAKGDWLLGQVDAKTKVYTNTEGHLILSNGLASRTFTLQPNVASVGLEELTKNMSYIRSVRPEAELTIDGIHFNVGGLEGQPIQNYILKDWIKNLKADPASFKYVSYQLEETKARFPWKKRLEWMPKDMPWPAPGKELTFTYRLDDQAIDEIVGRQSRDDQRQMIYTDNFTKLQPEWKLFESKAHDRNSFTNEGKVGEIMALSNTAVYAERAFLPGTEVVLVKVVPGTEKAASWGTGLGLVFADRVVKMNCRSQEHQVALFDGQRELQGIPVNDGQGVWLRFELKSGNLEASVSENKKDWKPVGRVGLKPGELPRLIRLGKMDRNGGNSDHGDKGDQGRSRVEAFSMLGATQANGSNDMEKQLAYLKQIEVKVHYELYDNFPVFSKWVTVENKGKQPITINAFKSEILAVVETESIVNTGGYFNYPGLSVTTDYTFGSMNPDAAFYAGIEWKKDKTFTSQVSWGLDTPCLLEVAPKIGPEQTIDPDQNFSTYRCWLLLDDNFDMERKTLGYRRMMRMIAPWVTENPILMHVRNADDASVKKAIDQCAEVGFEKVIMTFGSGFETEDISDKNIEKAKRLADYAHSKHLTLGSYSLLASRSIDKKNDVELPEGQNAFFGHSPCIGSEWGQKYFKNLYYMYEKTGLDNFEHDGSYPGDVCFSTQHPGHKGLKDSQWTQYKTITDFYKWCRGKGIYLNVPDYYFASGSNKVGMGYREVNWSLPREQQEIIERQNIFDGTWAKTPSMGWMFVPLVEYQGGGEAATIEPLKITFRITDSGWPICLAQAFRRVIADHNFTMRQRPRPW